MKLNKIISLALTVVMSSTLLVGCGKSKKSAQVLNIYNVGDYIDEDLITKFEEETGIDVVYETYDTNEAMYQKLKSGSTKYDLIFPSDYMVEKLISEDLVSPIDYSKIPNYKYIMKDFRNPAYDPGNKYSVPYMWGTFGILYNKTMVDEKDVDIMLYCEEFDEYYETVDDFFDDYACSHEEDGDERPVRLWVTSVEKIFVDAANVIENACSDLHEDAYERCDEGSLQKLLDDWCKEQTGTTTYYPCYKQYVEIDWNQYSE